MLAPQLQIRVWRAARVLAAQGPYKSRWGSACGFPSFRWLPLALRLNGNQQVPSGEPPLS